MTNERSSRQVPAAALMFAAAANVGQAAANEKTISVKITARTSGPVTHWYWGKIAHDMAGMTAADRIPLDYCHDPAEVIGYAEKPDVATGDLVLSGYLTPFKDGDRVDEIRTKAAAGVPYQASIFFSDMTLEDVPEGHTTQVNGQQFDGPGLVVRKWTLRGCAVCPYGQDKHTATEFAAADQQFTVSVFTAGDQMDPKTTAAAPVAKTGKDYLDAFGVDGGVYFAEGKSWDAAQTAYAAKLTADAAKARQDATELSAKLAAAETEAAELKAKLAAKPAGEQPVTFNADQTPPAGQSAASAGKFANLPTGLARFAAGIKLPGSK